MSSLSTPPNVDPSNPNYVEYPATGERMRFHTRLEDPASDPLDIDIWAPPGMEPLAAQVHPNQDETLAVEAGAMTASVDYLEQTVDAGDELTVPAGTPHT